MTSYLDHLCNGPQTSDNFTLSIVSPFLKSLCSLLIKNMATPLREPGLSVRVLAMLPPSCLHWILVIPGWLAGWLAGAPPLSCSCNCNLRRQSCRGRIRDGPHRPLRTTRKPPCPRKSTLNTPLFESSVLRCGVFQADAKKAAEVRESRRRREEGGLPRPR